VEATAGWTVLRRAESPAAEVFTVSYTARSASGDERRPVTFVFNGGPGASAAYLHVGLAGPRRVAFPDDGSLPAMPIHLVDNEASWIPFTDLVFIDPVGTGLSRPIPPAESGTGPGAAPSGPAPETGPGRWLDGGDRAATETGKDYFQVGADLTAMAEVIGRWLSANRRWDAPVFLAGESYGGYRVGRLAKLLQASEGVGLAGALLISPALELNPLSSSDYSIESYLDALPTMAATAVHHGRSRAGAADVAEAVAAAVEFAAGPYASFLVRGASMPADGRAAVFARLGELTGLSPEVIDRFQGRITIATFTRELLRDQRLVAGLYDATLTVVDPFPDRSPFTGPDPTLAGTTAAFTSGVNQLLRGEIGLETERRYQLLSMEVNNAWRPDDDTHALDAPTGAADDLRFGMALNPHLRVLVAHGRHDLVTPSQCSARVIDHMRLDASMTSRLDFRQYDGGHMFYTWATSRIAFGDDVTAFYRASLPT
jgi:carboxypeptidase C (cathepsin A)